MTSPTANRISAGPSSTTMVSGRCSRPVARPAATKMISPTPKKTSSASPVWPSFENASLAVLARITCVCAAIIRPPRCGGRTRRQAWLSRTSRAGPSAVDVGSDLLDALALAEPGGERLPLLSRADGGGHQVGGVEPEGGVRVGQVLRRQLVDRVGVEGLVDLLVGRDPSRGDLDARVRPLRGGQVVLHRLH